MSANNEVKWTKDLATGIRIVDLHHKRFFRLASLIMDKAAEGESQETVRQAVEFLRVYVVEHFGMEESLMSEHGYADIQAHKIEHARFRQTFAALYSRYQREGASPDIMRKLAYTTVDWLTNHIQHVDKKLCGFLEEEADRNTGLFAKLSHLAREFLSSAPAADSE